MHFTEYDVRLAAYALITREDQVLLSWYNGRSGGQPGWTLPGGGVEFEESLQTAVAREVLEETGYHVRVGQPLLVDSFTGPAQGDRKPFRSQRTVFDAVITGGELGTLEVDGSTDFARWVPLGEVRDAPSRTRLVDLALDVGRQVQSATDRQES